MDRLLMKRLRHAPVVTAHIMDRRSLLVLRGFLSIFVLYDLYSRLQLGSIDLAWYISSPSSWDFDEFPHDNDNDDDASFPSSRSFGSILPPLIHPTDTPHGAPLHRLWFHRGSSTFQLLLFGITAVAAVLFGLRSGSSPSRRAREGGVRTSCWSCGVWSVIVDVVLWLSVTSMQNRCTIINDGSDRFLRCLLLWCALVPTMEGGAPERSIVVGSFEEEGGSVFFSRGLQQRHGRDGKGESGGEGGVVGTTCDDDDDVIVDVSARSGGGGVLRRRVNRRSAPQCSNSNNDSKDRHLPPNPAALRPLQHPSSTTTTATQTSTQQIRSVAVLGLRLQITFMYIGTVYRRLTGTMWMHPQWTAVHYVLRSTFASRQWASDFVGGHPSVGRVMTCMAMVVEGVCPVLLLLVPYEYEDVDEDEDEDGGRRGAVAEFGNDEEDGDGKVGAEDPKQQRNGRSDDCGTTTKKGYDDAKKIGTVGQSRSSSSYSWCLLWCWTIFAISLVGLHFGLLLSVNLPNWQILGMGSVLAWIPGRAWDAVGWKAKSSSSLPPRDDGQSSSSRHRLHPTNGAPPPNKAHHRRRRETEFINRKGRRRRNNWSSYVREIFSWFFFLYMIYNWCGERGWIAKHDNGDVGEAIQFSQHWVMYGPDAPTTSFVTTVVGRLGRSGAHRTNNGDEVPEEGDGDDHRRIDFLRALKTGDWGPESELDATEYRYRRYDEHPSDMSSRFPHWRWENALAKWVKNRDNYVRGHGADRRLRRFAAVLCVVGNRSLPPPPSVGGSAREVTSVEVALRGLRILPPGSPKRFKAETSLDRTVEVNCNDVRAALV